MDKVKPDHRVSLAEALNFDEDTLEENAKGSLSLWQCAYLQTLRTDSLALLIGGIVFCILQFILLFTQQVLMLGFSGTILGAACLYALLRWLRLNLALRSRVESIEGVILLNIAVRGKSIIKYTLRIGDLRFEISKEAFLAFKNGDPYRIYYAPGAMIILSAEPLRSD